MGGDMFEAWMRRKGEIERKCGLPPSGGRPAPSAFGYGRLPDVGPWDVWCRRFGIDPNTPDERVLDDYLHGRTPGVALAWRDDHQRDAYACWASYDEACARLTPVGQRAQAKAEVYELERWWGLEL